VQLGVWAGAPSLVAGLVDHLVFSNTSARQRFASFQAAHLTLHNVDLRERHAATVVVA
jgi:hypothetical protein